MSLLIKSEGKHSQHLLEKENGTCYYGLVVNGVAVKL